MKPHTLLIMAGGTGGHVFPGLAIAHKMKDLGWDVQWVGTAEKMEANLVPKYDIPIHFIDVGGIRGKGIVTKLLTPFMLVHAIWQSIQLIKKIKPSIVLGMGGYASGPGGIATKIMGIPLVIHEQNAVFGMTNRYLSKLAKKVLTGFDLSSMSKQLGIYHKTLFVGNPIREEFFHIPLKESKDNEGANKANILIVGGSLGALALNQIVPVAIKNIKATFNLKVKHQTGANKITQVKEAYAGVSNIEIMEFIDNISDALNWADIIICRAGALTVAEVSAAGRVAIFVPLPIAVDDHQTKNAQWLSDKHAAIIIPQSELEQALESTLNELVKDIEKRQAMGKTARQLSMRNATTEVAKVLHELIGLDYNNANSPSQKEQA